MLLYLECSCTIEANEYKTNEKHDRSKDIERRVTVAQIGQKRRVKNV